MAWRRKYDGAVSPRLLRVSVGLEEAGHLNQLSNPYIMNEVKQKCRDVIKTTN